MSRGGALPLDFNSDKSMPGRYEESNREYEIIFQPTISSKPKNNALVIGVIIFGIFSIGFYSFYYFNQSEIDSEISKNTIGNDEALLIEKYQVGRFGSDHQHAAILITIGGEQLNLGIQQFQLKSKYIHFEDGNTYLIHRHATGVPLEMLFSSINIEITENCIVIQYYNDEKEKEFCNNDKLQIFINDKEFEGNLLEYVIKQNDRILISDESRDLKKYLNYLNSFEIPNLERKQFSNNGNEIFI